MSTERENIKGKVCGQKVSKIVKQIRFQLFSFLYEVLGKMKVGVLQKVRTWNFFENCLKQIFTKMDMEIQVLKREKTLCVWKSTKFVVV